MLPPNAVGIRAIQGDHGLIDVRARFGVQAARDLGERVALGDRHGARASPRRIRRRLPPAERDSAGALGAAATDGRARTPPARSEPEERRDRERRPDFGSGVGSDVAADEVDGVGGRRPPSRRHSGPSRGLGVLAVLGAVTGAEEPAFSPGVYTGGSSSTVYSRIRWPRAQLTSTRKVTKGSGIDVGRAHRQHIAAVLALADLEGERGQERRTVDAVAGEGLARREASRAARSAPPGSPR